MLRFVFWPHRSQKTAGGGGSLAAQKHMISCAADRMDRRYNVYFIKRYDRREKFFNIQKRGVGRWGELRFKIYSAGYCFVLQWSFMPPLFNQDHKLWCQICRVMLVLQPSIEIWCSVSSCVYEVDVGLLCICKLWRIEVIQLPMSLSQEESCAKTLHGCSLQSARIRWCCRKTRLMSSSMSCVLINICLSHNVCPTSLLGDRCTQARTSRQNGIFSAANSV